MLGSCWTSDAKYAFISTASAVDEEGIGCKRVFCQDVVNNWTAYAATAIFVSEPKPKNWQRCYGKWKLNGKQASS